MTVKMTIIMQLSTNVSDPTKVVRRIGGWTESWYYPGLSIPAALAAAKNPIGDWGGGLLSYRAALLPLGGAIVGMRFQLVNPVGPSQSISEILPGTATTQADIPQMALLCRVPAVGANNIRPLILRGIPDARVVEGEYLPSQAFSNDLVSFFQSLSGWQFRGRDLSNPGSKIISIAAGGNFITEAATGFAPMQMVRILRSQDEFGDFVSGRFQVDTIGPGTNQGHLLNWGSASVSGGTIRPDGIVFLNVDSKNIGIGRIITRRVGRPSIQYRGRRSRKRK